jgi:DnaJ domain
VLDRECLRILGLSSMVPAEEIRKSYRRMVKELHPDTGLRPDSAEFSRVVEAYRTLTERGSGKRIIDFPVREARPPVRPEPRKSQPSTSAGRVSNESIFEIGNLLLKGKTPHLRAFAAMRLGNSGRVSSYSYLRKGLYDEDPQVVLASVQAIGRLKIQHSASELAAVFRQSGEGVKLSILDAVYGMRNRDGFRGIIMQGMQEEASAVRRKSLQMFKQFSH